MRSHPFIKDEKLKQLLIWIYLVENSNFSSLNFGFFYSTSRDLIIQQNKSTNKQKLGETQFSLNWTQNKVVFTFLFIRLYVWSSPHTLFHIPIEVSVFYNCNQWTLYYYMVLNCQQISELDFKISSFDDRIL